VREVIEDELDRIFDGRKTVQEGLDRAVIRGNAILRAFAATNRPWPREI
jgi:sn-glycerol 3-phosphate transport system substrate-binding protein